jgi:superfamily I DNA/RNA helicase
MHSAKGLEFDHVIAIGLSQDMMEQDLDENDERMAIWRKLLAMAIGRAKCSVVLGYKPKEGSRLLSYLDPDTYETVVV